MNMERLLSGKLTSKGQLTIPAELRSYLNMEEGDRLEFVVDPLGGLSVTPKKKKSIKDVVGSLQRDEIDFDKARQIAQAARSEDLSRKGRNE
jgi:antitoxin PrlF